MKTSPKREFREYLRSRGLRFTPERRAILKEVFRLHRHFDVELLYEILKKRGERISQATIYRFIPLLIDSGMIKRATHLDGHVSYEHIFGHKPHHHLVCISCGKIEEFYDQGMEERLRKICRNHNFTPVEHRLGVRGICSECRRKQAKQKTRRIKNPVARKKERE